MSSAAAPPTTPPAFRWKTSKRPLFPQHFDTSTLLPYNLMYLPTLLKKLLFARSEVGENTFLKMAQYLLTHLDPHMMHKLFDTDSTSFQQSGNVLRIPSGQRLLQFKDKKANSEEIH